MKKQVVLLILPHQTLYNEAWSMADVESWKQAIQE